MSRQRFWRFTCDTCGRCEDFKSLYIPRMTGWKHRKNGFNLRDYCSDKCYEGIVADHTQSTVFCEPCDSAYRTYGCMIATPQSKDEVLR